MNRFRLLGTVLAVAVVMVVAGCGGSTEKSVTSIPTTTVALAATTAPTRTTAPPTKPAPSTKPTSVDLAQVQAELRSAGSALDASGSDISGVDVKQARSQEGSAP